ncbi:hypothetical protein M3Y94_00852300 [Aphelenchoides besseyi]|nr:hypothetical protein M3Y94_00852300 [Aphelenchoides besseyi]KAI6226818.1 Metallo-beta-lactamase domain-containing protein 1 [Aphelenchoides besseyi]
MSGRTSEIKAKELFGILYENKKNDWNVHVDQEVVGYCNNETGQACGSVTKVCIGNYVIQVDCGLPDVKFEESEERTTLPDCIMLTHYHSDHVGRLFKFAHVKQVLPCNPDAELPFEDMAGFGKKDPRQHLQLLKLSGHSPSDLVLLVKPGEDSDELIAIVGDIFENLDDYSAIEPAIPPCNLQKLQESRQQIRDLKPSIVVPGHGPAFRLRFSCPLEEGLRVESLMEQKLENSTVQELEPKDSCPKEMKFGRVVVHEILPRTQNYDAVWMIAVGDIEICVNSRLDEVKFSKWMSKKIHALVILEPSNRCASAIGLFRAESVYMGNDVLQNYDHYRTLEEEEWIVDNLIRVSRDFKPETLKLEVYDEHSGKVSMVLSS